MHDTFQFDLLELYLKTKTKQITQVNGHSMIAALLTKIMQRNQTWFTFIIHRVQSIIFAVSTRAKVEIVDKAISS